MFGKRPDDKWTEYTEFGMRARYLLALCLTAWMQAQEDPADLLRFVRANVSRSLDQTLKYMCTQTIDRAQFEPNGYSGNTNCDAGSARTVTHLTTSDRLRLDVAMTSTTEMYSWVGENRFGDRELLDMVHEGAISTGEFAEFLKLIFRTDEATFTYNGESAENGQALAEFGFRVPYEKSHYLIGLRPTAVVTGYEGTLLVDAKTGDLVRMVVRTNRLPAETAACYATTTMYYTHLRLNDSDNVLFPADVRLHIVGTNGYEWENHTVFSACHKFVGESAIKFETPAGGVAAAVDRPAASGITIPPGLPFRVALTQAIDTATAAAGDPITAKLITPIRNGSVLVPAGAAVVGRLVRVRQFYGSNSSLEIDIKLETVGVGSRSVPLIATPDVGRSFQKPMKGFLRQRVELGTLRSLEDRTAAFVFRDVHRPYLISSGLESMWVTATPAAGDSISKQK